MTGDGTFRQRMEEQLRLPLGGGQLRWDDPGQEEMFSGFGDVLECVVEVLKHEPRLQRELIARLDALIKSSGPDSWRSFPPRVLRLLHAL